MTAHSASSTPIGEKPDIRIDDDASFKSAGVEKARRSGKIELFRDYPDPKIFISATSQIVTVEDRTDPKRHVIVHFDTEGRLLDIVLGESFLSNKTPLLERAFYGKYSVFPENCRNLARGHKGVSYHYDYWNERVETDDRLAKFLVDDVIRFVSRAVRGQGIDPEVARSFVPFLRNVIEKYGWDGLAKNDLYRQAYPTPITVLPPNIRPDRAHNFAVLQIATGCPRVKRCGFCASFAGVEYREKTTEEVQAHIRDVERFHGSGWRAVSKAFLSDGDPLATRSMSPRAYFDVIQAKTAQVKALHSFVSTQTILSKSAEEWRELLNRPGRLGLEMVYWGVESADDATLRLIDKHHSERHLYEAVDRLHEAGLPFAVIIMSGLGGLQLDRNKDDVINNDHVRKTNAFIKYADPAVTYISKFIPLPGTSLFDAIVSGKLRQLSQKELDRQHQELDVNAFFVDRENHQTSRTRYVVGSYGGQFI